MNMCLNVPGHAVSTTVSRPGIQRYPEIAMQLKILL
jgi:hypothetical protein